MNDRRALIESAYHCGIGVSMAFREPEKMRNTLGYSAAAIRIRMRDLRWLILKYIT